MAKKKATKTKRPTKKTTKKPTKAAAKPPEEKKSRGPAIKRDETPAEPSRCRRCGSTKRSKYKGSPRVMHVCGEFDGKPYNRIESRLTKCLDCHQHRSDISHHYSPKLPN